MFSLVARQPKKSLCRNNYESATITTCSKINTSGFHFQYIMRAGIVPFTQKDGKLFFCFGKHKKSGELTDFGGRKKPHETLLQCAIREANEETKYAFGELRVQDLLNQDCICLFNNKMIIIFAYVKAQDDHMENQREDIIDVSQRNFNQEVHLPSRFLHGKLPHYFEEISELHWLSEEELMNCFSPEPRVKMYAIVRRLIMSCQEFSQSTESMKEILLGKEPARAFA